MKLPAWLASLLAKTFGISKALLEEILPILRDRSARLLAAAVPIALEYVVDAASRGSLSGSDKANYVKSAVRAALIAEGIATAQEISGRLLNRINELALARAEAEGLLEEPKGAK